MFKNQIIDFRKKEISAERERSITWLLQLCLRHKQTNYDPFQYGTPSLNISPGRHFFSSHGNFIGIIWCRIYGTIIIQNNIKNILMIKCIDLFYIFEYLLFGKGTVLYRGVGLLCLYISTGAKHPYIQCRCGSYFR